MTVNRDTARRFTARARVATLALLVGVAAVVALPLPMLRPAASAGTIADLDPGPAAPTSAAKPKRQIEDMEIAISRIWGHSPPAVEVPPPAATPTTPAAGDKPAVTEAPPPPGGWRYIGSIMGPRGVRALMEHDGRQSLVRIGDEVSGARITAIEVGQVTINERGVPKQIKLADRASRWDTAHSASLARSSVPARPLPAGANTRVGGQVPRNTTVAPPPQSPVYSTEMGDEERMKYEQQKLEKYRESGEESGMERPDDGGRR